MKVIVASFPKCGTKTLKRCLTILGYSVYDVDENFTFLEEEWKDIMTKGSSAEKFKRMYENVDAVSDILACHYWEGLLEAFPEVKIILTTRKTDEDWLKTWTAQFHEIKYSVAWQLRGHLTPTGRRFANFERLKGRVVFDCPEQGYWGLMDQDPEILKRKYREHVQSVLEKAPKEKLLVTDFKDGWKPICEFLGKEIPDDPFPYVHKGANAIDLGVAPIAFGRIETEFQVVKAFSCAFLALIAYFIWQIS